VLLEVRSGSDCSSEVSWTVVGTLDTSVWEPPAWSVATVIVAVVVAGWVRGAVVVVYCSAALVGRWEVALERPISVLSTLVSVGCHEIVVAVGVSGRLVMTTSLLPVRSWTVVAADPISVSCNSVDEILAAYRELLKVRS
jgi:hypothetical protein